MTFTSTAPSPAYVGDSYTVTATGAASGNAVTFSSLTTGVCTVSGSMVTFVAAGGCSVAGDQAGNATYADATQATQSITVAKRPQRITFAPALPAESLIGSQLTVGQPVAHRSIR